VQGWALGWPVRGVHGEGTKYRYLYGVRKVALDPSPEMVNQRTVGLVSLLRESFLGLIMSTKYYPGEIEAQERAGARGRTRGRKPAPHHPVGGARVPGVATYVRRGCVGGKRSEEVS